MANKITYVLATLLTASGILVSANAMACSEQDYVGSVCFVAASYCPQGTVPADGSTTSNQTLKSVLGSDKLPSLKAPAGTKYCVTVEGTYPQRP